MRAPFEIHRPEGVAALLYDSPHSGRYYPPDFELASPMSEVRRGEDAYVDELLLPSVARGAVLLTSTYPRCYIDVNRAPNDIAPDQIAGAWPGPLEPTEKSRRGLGLIRRFVSPGIPVQVRPLPVAEVRSRLENVYAPYHGALDALVAESLETVGAVWHVDWHSMKSLGNAMTPDGEGAVRPDFVVSDGNGTTAAPAFTDVVVDTLRALGYRVSVNDPYTGGSIVKRIGRPRAGIHSLQVEIKRSLYLDEARVEKTSGFIGLAERLASFTETVRLWAAGRNAG